MPDRARSAAASVALLLSLLSSPAHAGRSPDGGTVLIDKRAVIARATWLDNRDTDWYLANVPFVDTPDRAIDDTFLYRFDMMTKHFVYGSPDHGYAVTEFIDRPSWSGTYGAISCPVGLQFADLRWLRDQRITRDYARYWMHVPGAQPRSYSNWFGAAMWGLYQAWGDRPFILSMLPDMKAQYAGWEAERWDKRYSMFVWDGMHDGMETNINSRQTPKWFEGAPGVRPTLNSYMYADALAIARTARLAGDTAVAATFDAKAAALKKGVQEMLWAKDRRFFLHMFADDEKLADGRPGTIRAGTLTYESGLHAGDPHGRELIGYVPWQFGLPDAGYEAAWRGIGDPDVFAARFGPTSAERHDPLFMKTERCCTWSGNSWPFATSQTLEAMANLLNDYRQNVVSPADYYRLLRTFSLTQRHNGVPFVAEAADPDTGAWQIQPNHSEHYFHSSYVDLVVTGLAGLRPRDDDRLVVNPLIPRDWDWFALENVPYHGHLVSIVWDRDGSRYRRGRGLSLIVDGKVAASTAELGRLEAVLTPSMAPSYQQPRLANFAVNNGKAAFPRVTASFSQAQRPVSNLNDGAFWYLKAPGNRWTTEGSRDASSTVQVDLGAARILHNVTLYFLDDGDGAAVRAPVAYRVEYLAGGAWKPLPLAGGLPTPVGHRPTELRLVRSLEIRRLRIILIPAPRSAVGLTEVEAWGAATPSPST